MTDGSVKSISETIDVGNLADGDDTNDASVYAGRSPYGTWVVLGTRAGGEVADEF